MTSSRLAVGTWTPEDLPLATALWNDAEVTLFHGGPWSARQISAWLDHEVSNLAQHRVQYWPLFLRNGGEHVGCCGLRPLDAVNGIYELGCHLRRAFWSQHLGREAAREVITHAAGTLDMQALQAGHHPGNDASRRFLQYLGFVYTHEEFYAPTGLVEPRYVLAPAAAG